MDQITNVTQKMFHFSPQLFKKNSLTQLLHVSASLVHHQGVQLYETVISAQQAKEVYQFKHAKERFIKPFNMETVV